MPVMCSHSAKTYLIAVFMESSNTDQIITWIKCVKFQMQPVSGNKCACCCEMCNEGFTELRPGRAYLRMWRQEYTEELYKKGLHDPDNHDNVITHLEPDILQCEVKWALGNITMNKASGGDGIPVELFQIQEMMLWKCCTRNANKFGKLSSGHRTGKGQFSFQSLRKAIPKNAQTTTQLHSSHMLVK